VHPVYAYSPGRAPPPFFSLDMCAPCPHTTSASVWVAVWHPVAVDLGGVVGGYHRLKGESTKFLCELDSAGEVAITSRRSKLSGLSDVRRGPITSYTVHTRSEWKVANARVVTITITQIGQSQRQPAQGVVLGQHKC
jgi:hypothetical protein